MRHRAVVRLVLVGCARAPQGPVIPREPRTVPVLHAGDAIRIEAWDDASIAGISAALAICDAKLGTAQ